MIGYQKVGYDYEAVRSRKQLEHGFTYDKHLKCRVSDYCSGCGREPYGASYACYECCVGSGLAIEAKTKTILRKKKQ